MISRKVPLPLQIKVKRNEGGGGILDMNRTTRIPLGTSVGRLLNEMSKSPHRKIYEELRNDV